MYISFLSCEDSYSTNWHKWRHGFVPLMEIPGVDWEQDRSFFFIQFFLYSVHEQHNSANRKYFIWRPWMIVNKFLPDFNILWIYKFTTCAKAWILCWSLEFNFQTTFQLQCGRTNWFIDWQGESLATSWLQITHELFIYCIASRGTHGIIIGFVCNVMLHFYWDMTTLSFF